MNYTALTTNVLFTWDETKPEHDSGIQLLTWLSKEVGWATAHICGPQSVITPGDKILMSRRVVTYNFELDGEPMGNTSDASCLAYKHNDQLYATGKTVLYSWLTPQEEVTESGIVLVRKERTKELELRWARVHAAGSETGVQPGQEVLLAWKHDAYAIKDVIPGVELHNAGCEEVVCIRPSSTPA